MNADSQSFPPPRTRHGRTGWLVLLAGILGAGGMSGIVALVQKTGGAEPAIIEVAIGFAAAVFLVFLGWSAVLAARALYWNEGSTSSLLLLNAIAFFPAAAALACWLTPPTSDGSIRDSLFQFYIPALIPFLFLALVQATLVVKPVVRRIEKRRVWRGRPAWTRRERWRRGTIAAVLCALPLGLIVLPMPVFLISAARHGNDAPDAVLSKSPNIVRDAAESVLHAISPEEWSNVHDRLLRHGLMSERRLEQRVLAGGTNTTWEYAIEGLLKQYPREAAAFAERMLCDPQARGTVTMTQSLAAGLSHLIVEGGTAEQLRKLIAQTARETQPIALVMFHQLQPYGTRYEAQSAVIGSLKEVLAGTQPNHEMAALALAASLPRHEARQLLAEQFAASNPALIWRDMGSISPQMFQTMHWDSLDHGNIEVQRRAISRIHWWPGRNSAFPIPGVTKEDFARKLLTRLNGSDIVQQRAAAIALVRTATTRPIRLGTLTPPFEPADPTKPVEGGGEPLPMTEAEVSLFKQIATEVEEWLKSLVKGKQ